jgi:Lipocalin-like domain
MKRLFFSAAIAALALTSCKKDKGDEQKAITKENIIGTYKISSFKGTITGFPEVDVLQQLEPCQRDDQYSFKAGDVMDYIDAGTQCDPVGTETSSWTLTGDMLSIEGSDVSGKVTSLTASTIELTESVSEQGITYTSKIVLTRQ